MCGSTSMSAYRPFGMPTCRVCGIQDTRHAGRPVGVPACRHDSTPTPDRRPCTSAFRKRSEPDGRQVGVSAGRDSDWPACPSLAGSAARPASCSAYRVSGLPECRPHAPACPMSERAGCNAPWDCPRRRRFGGACLWSHLQTLDGSAWLAFKRSAGIASCRHAGMWWCLHAAPGARVNPRPGDGRPRLRAAELRSALPAGR